MSKRSLPLGTWCSPGFCGHLRLARMKRDEDAKSKGGYANKLEGVKGSGHHPGGRAGPLDLPGLRKGWPHSGQLEWPKRVP